MEPWLGMTGEQRPWLFCAFSFANFIKPNIEYGLRVWTKFIGKKLLWSLNLHQTLLQFVFYDDDNMESHDEQTSTQTAAATTLVISYISNHCH